MVSETDRRVAALSPVSADDVRQAGGAVAGFSAGIAKADEAIKEFLYARMYRHARISRIMGDAEGVVRDLFKHYCAVPEDMPSEWARGAEAGEEVGRLRRIADFIAGMTDRYALSEHARFFNVTPELR